MSTNRYDFMDEGYTKDPIIGDNYPDPLTLNYLDFFLNTIYAPDPGVEVKLDETNIENFAKLTNDIYGLPIYDDIVLTLNNVPHKNFLQIGDVIRFPNREYIDIIFKKERI